MVKEIYEQPEVVGHTLAHFIDLAEGKVRLPDGLAFSFADLPRVTISACGTAYYAGLVAKYWFERFARLPVDIDVASEFRYRNPPLQTDGLSIFISQSGETADTLASLRYCRENGQHVLSVVNVPEFDDRAGSRKPCSPRSPVRRSASRRPRRSPASSLPWLAWPSRRGGARRH